MASPSGTLVKHEDKYKTHIVYTDGSCLSNQYEGQARAGYGVYYGPDDKRNVSAKLKGIQSSYNAELAAIKCAVDAIHKETTSLKNPTIRYVIATDSNACLNHIQNFTTAGRKVANNNTLYSIVTKIKEISAIYQKNGLDPFVFEKVKGHSDNFGNNSADRLAYLGAMK